MTPVTITTTTMGFNVGVSKKGEIHGSHLTIMEYTKRWELWEYDKQIERWVMKNEFFHFDRDNERCYFPLFDLHKFREFLSEQGVASEVVVSPPTQGAPVNFLMLPHIEYKNDKQRAAVEYLTNPDSGPLRGLALQTGVGKAQPLYSNIKTPNGWGKMGDMKIGSEVIAHDGTVTEVTGVYPQGLKQIYRITFEDGRFTECCEDHLFRVYYVQWKEKWRVISLKEISEYLKLPTYRQRMGIQLPKPESKDDIDLPIDPYLLGVLLGDGTLVRGSVRLSNPDQEILDSVAKLIPLDMKLQQSEGIDYYITQVDPTGTKTSAFLDKFRSLGLYGTRSDTKFIPDIYLNASPSQQLRLVQGLMDTDGTVSKNGCVSFCTTSLDMVCQLQNIIRGLGGLARVSIRYPHYTYNGEKRAGKVTYQLNIRFSDSKSLFQLTRKQNLVPDNYQYADRLRAHIKSVEFVGEYEAQCISIAHPDHLYITDNYVVTHNTVSAIWALQKLGVRSMITMTSRLEQWVKEMGVYTTLEEDDLYVIQGVGSLTKLFNQIDDLLKPKIILASTSTVRRYLEYEPSYQHLPHPSEMCEKLNVGIVATDEYHEHFFTNFMIGIMLNPALFIPITATFSGGGNPFIKNIFDNFVPKNVQFTGGAYERFVNVYAYQYRGGAHQIKPFHYMSPRGYSQQMFEKYLLGRGRKLLDSMVEDAILPIIREHYINIAEKGERFLFLCSSTALCDHLEGIFKRAFRDKTVSTFYSGMPTNILERFDMILSTPGSAGTGRDVKKLRTCFVFENVESETRNLQFIGRLRGPPQMMNTPEYVYLSMAHLPQHIKYHNARSILYGPRALNFYHRVI